MARFKNRKPHYRTAFCIAEWLLPGAAMRKVNIQLESFADTLIFFSTVEYASTISVNCICFTFIQIQGTIHKTLPPP